MKTTIIIKSEFIEILFENAIYKINIKKLLYVISRLSNKTIVFENESQILYYFEKFKLFDKHFLKSMQNQD